MCSCHVTPSLIYNNLTTSSDGQYAAYAHLSEVVLINLVCAAERGGGAGKGVEQGAGEGKGRGRWLRPERKI